MVRSVSNSVPDSSNSLLALLEAMERPMFASAIPSRSIFSGPFEGSSFRWSAEPIFSRGSSPVVEEPVFRCGVKDEIAEEPVFRCGVKDEPVKTEEPLVCTLMATEIPSRWVLKIGEDPFDLRYFVKSVLTQKSPINPYTRQKLTPEELEKICTPIGITPAEFEGIWTDGGEGLQGLGLIIRSMGLLSQVFEISNQIHQARVRGDAPSVQRLEARMEGVRRELEQLGGVEDSSRRKNLEKLLLQAAEKGKISREDANEFILKLSEGG